MAFDFQVVFPQEAVNLTSVRVAEDIPVRTLDITGVDFRSVDEVVINDIVSPSVVVLSRSRLLAQVPVDVLYQQISSVRVTSRKLFLTDRSYIKFQVGRSPSKVSGILRLVQLFLKILFTTPGTDIFTPATGAGALGSIGRTFGRDEGGTIVSDFILGVAATQKQIIAAQGRDPAIPRDERLLAAKVLRANYSKSEAALVVSLELTSQAGRAATANVML